MQQEGLSLDDVARVVGKAVLDYGLRNEALQAALAQAQQELAALAAKVKGLEESIGETATGPTDV